MTAQVYAVRLVPNGNHVAHISDVRILDRLDGGVLQWPVAQLIQWIEGTPGAADVISNGGMRAVVQVVHPTSGPPFIRTNADGTTADNLLSLPRF